MAAVRWSLNASQNLKDVAQYLNQYSPQAASRFVDEVDEAIKRLEEHPLIGRSVPEFASPSIREIVLRGYRMIYEVGEDQVGLLAILHGRQNILARLGGNPQGQ